MTTNCFRPPFSVTAVVAIVTASPIGYSTRALQAAMAAGLRDFRETTVLGPDVAWVRSSRLPDLDEEVPRDERIAILTSCALADLLERTTIDFPEELDVFVGVASDTPASDLEAVRGALVNASPSGVDTTKIKFACYADGRIAFFSALAGAAESLDEGRSELALVVAVDTRCTAPVIEALMREKRLLTGRNDGTIPGEAAVVALVAHPRSSFAIDSGFLIIVGPVFGEDDPEKMRQSPQATDGLGRAFRTIREHPVVDSLKPEVVIAFDTGELPFTRAFATAYLRNAELMPEPLRHELVATSLGETGAAAGGIAVVRADGIMQDFVNGEQCTLIYGHADSGRCAAALAIRRSA